MGQRLPEDLAHDEERFIPLFIGGAPRSGTTILHALICTSDQTNGYIEECSYFGAFMQPFLVGLQRYDIHTRYYFASRDEFCRYHAAILQRVLSDFWRKVGCPAILALKDPMLTPHFHSLARMLRHARFIVIARDPYDTISSRIEVMRRLNGGAAPKRKAIQRACAEYAEWYRAVLDHRHCFGDRLCLVDYGRLIAGEEFAKLERFGIAGLNPDRVWSDAITDISAMAGQEWHSPLYGRTLTDSSIGRHRRDLSHGIRALVEETCGDVSRQLGFQAEPRQRWPTARRQLRRLLGSR